MDFKNYLVKMAMLADVGITNEQAEKFRIYKDFLTEKNKVMNLTALTEDEDIAVKHFLDSISPIKFTDLSDKSCIDVGTGAGFPSVPLKIMCPDIKLTLLDSLRKRMDFLEELCGKLDFDNMRFIHSRAEDAGKNTEYREMYDFCFSRAVASLPVLCEYCLPFLKKGGVFIALKGPLINDEAESAKNALDILGGKIADIKEFFLPEYDICHYIAFIEKTAHTPEKYPRKSSKIQKMPL